MADFDAMMKGMQLFQQGVKTFTTARAINQAQDEVNQLANSEMDEMEKRQKLTAISQNMALNMLKGGADVNDVQVASAKVAPVAINTPMDAYMQGQLTGSKKLQEVGTKTQNFEDATKERDRAMHRDIAKLNSDTQLQVAGIKASSTANRLRPLQTPELAELNGLDDEIVTGSNLISEVKRNPWLVGPVAGATDKRGKVDPRYAAFSMEADTWLRNYIKRMSGSQVTDQERDELKAIRPGTTNSTSEFLAKANKAIEIAQNIKKRRIRQFQIAGRDVRGFLAEIDQEQAAPPPSGQSSSPQGAPDQQQPQSRLMQFIEKPR